MQFNNLRVRVLRKKNKFIVCIYVLLAFKTRHFRFYIRPTISSIIDLWTSLILIWISKFLFVTFFQKLGIINYLNWPIQKN